MHFIKFDFVYLFHGFSNVKPTKSGPIAGCVTYSEKFYRGHEVTADKTVSDPTVSHSVIK